MTRSLGDYVRRLRRRRTLRESARPGVAGLLLDSNVPAALVASVKRVVPDCPVHHLADWRDSAFLHASDEDILEKACEDGLVLVTYDTATVPAIVHDWIAQGRRTAGVALISSRSSGSADLGGLARALGELYTGQQPLDPAYPVVYLRPPPNPLDDSKNLPVK